MALLILSSDWNLMQFNEYDNEQITLNPKTTNDFCIINFDSKAKILHWKLLIFQNQVVLFPAYEEIAF